MGDDDFNLFDNLDRFEKMIKENRSEFFEKEEILSIVRFYKIIYSDLFEKAIDYGLKLYPGSSELLLYKSNFFLEKEELKKAFDILKKIESFEKRNPNYWENWVIYYLKRGNLSKALSMAQKGDQVYLKFDKADYFTALANEFNNHNHVNEAILYYQKAIQADPYDEYPKHKLARLYIKEEEYQKALEIYDYLLDEDPFDVDAWFFKGVIHEELEQIEEALSAYGFAYAIDPKDDEVIFKLAYLLYSTLKFSEALQIIDDYVKQNSLTPELCLLLLNIYQEKHNHEYLKYYALKLIELLETAPAPEYNNGLLTAYKIVFQHYLQEKKILLAIQYIEKALLQYNEITLWFFLSLSKLLQGQHKEAALFITKACKLPDPSLKESRNILETITNIFDKQTRIDAITHFAKILKRKKLTSQMAYIHVYKAQGYMEFYDFSNASKELNNAIKCAMKNSEIAPDIISLIESDYRGLPWVDKKVFSNLDKLKNKENKSGYEQ